MIEFLLGLFVGWFCFRGKLTSDSCYYPSFAPRADFTPNEFRNMNKYEKGSCQKGGNDHNYSNGDGTFSDVCVWCGV